MVVQHIVRIREAQRSDMNKILEIENRSFPDPYPLSLLNYLHGLYPYGFLVAELGGEVIGYVIGALRGGAEGHILAVAVDRPHLRKGIGSHLIFDVMNRLAQRGARSVKLEVRKSNRIAQLFYSRLGFERRGEIPYYYEDGETAVIMTHRI